MLRKIVKPAIRTLTTGAKTTTVDASEVHHFKQFSSEWWDVLGPLKALHSMNKLRLPLIRDGLINTEVAKTQHVNTSQPLKDLSILDVGCGAGILCEPLARIGSNVTGLDASGDLIEAAKLHGQLENLTNIRYETESLEEHAIKNADKYDAVVASEVIEHVKEKEKFLEACVKCLKPGGSIFLTTLNKTWFTNFAGIFLAENLLQLLPKGTHDFEKCIEPHKLQRLLEEQNCKCLLVHGLFYNPLTNEWSWWSNALGIYAIHCIKLKK